MPARIASVDLGPGHRLSVVRLFHEPTAGRHRFDTDAAQGTAPEPLRALLMGSGLWRGFRSRPFGRIPAPDDRPAAIFVMAVDTRPLAPDPRDALDAGLLEQGIGALLRLTDGPVFLCQGPGADILPRKPERLRIVTVGADHPGGLAGFQIHKMVPARPGRAVWDIHAEDAAGIGELLSTGHVPDTRLVAVAGPALRAARLLRCQPGADLRGLCYGFEKPGVHRILSGSALDGREARWLGDRDRQVTVLDAPSRKREGHWLLSALQQAARPRPLIPSAALEQAMGGALPVLPFLRALASGDAETFKRLGGLSLVEEDLALVDYVANADPPFTSRMREMLHRIATEEAA